MACLNTSSGLHLAAALAVAYCYNFHMSLGSSRNATCPSSLGSILVINLACTPALPASRLCLGAPATKLQQSCPHTVMLLQILEPSNVKRIVEEADGYQPHLIAPEMGYRRLLQECLVLFKGPADTAVGEVHHVLRSIVASTINSDDCKNLQQYTGLKREIVAAASASLGIVWPYAFLALCSLRQQSIRPFCKAWAACLKHKALSLLLLGYKDAELKLHHF